MTTLAHDAPDCTRCRPAQRRLSRLRSAYTSLQAAYIALSGTVTLARDQGRREGYAQGIADQSAYEHQQWAAIHDWIRQITPREYEEWQRSLYAPPGYAGRAPARLDMAGRRRWYAALPRP